MAVEEEQNQPGTEQQGPDEQSMETSTGDDSGQDQEKKEKEKRKEAKVYSFDIYQPHIQKSSLLVSFYACTQQELITIFIKSFVVRQIISFFPSWYKSFILDNNKVILLVWRW